MKGKVAFVVGAAVGYVLGTRAGRERYEQIKRGAQSVWNSAPVQQRVHVVQDLVDDKVDGVKHFARRVGGELFATIVRQSSPAQPTGQASSEPAGGASASAGESPSKPKPGRAPQQRGSD